MSKASSAEQTDQPKSIWNPKRQNTEQNLLKVVNFISNALNNGNYCIGVFLDRKKFI